MFKSLAEDSRLMYCGCSGDGAGGDAACSSGDGGGDGGDSGGPSAAQAAAANTEGGFAVNGDGSFTTNEGTFSDDGFGGVSFDGDFTSMDLGNEAAPSLSVSAQMATPAEMSASTAPAALAPAQAPVDARPGYQSAFDDARTAMKKAVEAGPSYRDQSIEQASRMAPTVAPSMQGLHDQIMEDEMVTQQEQQQYMNQLDQAFPAGTAQVSEVDPMSGTPGEDPTGKLDYIGTLNDAIVRTAKETFDRIGKDVEGLMSGKPMTHLGKDIYSNVPGSYIDSAGNYSTADPSSYNPNVGGYTDEGYTAEEAPFPELEVAPLAELPEGIEEQAPPPASYQTRYRPSEQQINPYGFMRRKFPMPRKLQGI